MSKKVSKPVTIHVMFTPAEAAALGELGRLLNAKKSSLVLCKALAKVMKEAMIAKARRTNAENGQGADHEDE